jgi:predicted Zn-dependent peptidase
VLGPPRTDPEWPAFAVATGVLGGGPAGRLFTELREQQGLAYTTFSRPVEVTRGPTPLLAYAGTQTEKTGVALQSLLEHAERMATTAPTPGEVEVATRFLADTFAVRMQTVGAIVSEIARLRLLALPDDYNDRYRKELLEVTPALAGKLAGEYVRPAHAIIAVSGDAAVIGPMLSHFGEVKVLDPTREFERVRTIPMNKSAPLESPPPKP